MQAEKSNLKLQKQKIELIVIGNQNSGKTSLVKRFVEGEKVFSHFYNPTLGINLEKREITLDGMLVSVNIWDTAGQEKFLALTKNYFRKADGVLVIFDLTDKNSFDKVFKFWVHEVNDKTSEDTSQVIIGNKVDMQKERVVDYDEARKMASQLNLAYFQTSAKTGENVNEAIHHIVRDCLKKIRSESGGGVTINPQGTNNRGSCFSGMRDYVANFFSKPNQQ